jgi:hypothetical protein
MEWTILRSSVISQGIHVMLGVATAVIAAATIWAIDRFMFKKIDLEEEVGRGNLAAAVLAGAMWIALAMIFTRG